MKHKTIRTASAFLFVSLLIAAPRAQQPAPVATPQSQEDRIALYQALLDLTNPWTVMCIAAHPDDEDGTSLIVMRRKHGAHTVSLFTTFGEGGQNAIGPELYEELGAIRARETMAAAEIQGSEPYFLGLKDFGYSKSDDEAFRIWGHDEALRRMVLQIRKLRPDVIITNHAVTNNDHGHHQATARLVLEAFDAAADPKRFPEQLKDGVTTWQVQRLFVRVRGNQGQNPDRQGGGNDLVTIDPNERDPIRRTSFAEQALQGLQKHATQGPWPKSMADLARLRNSPDGKLPLIRYRLIREAGAAAPLKANVQNFTNGLQLPDLTAKRLPQPTLAGEPLTDFVDQRDRVLQELLAIDKDLPKYEPTANDRPRFLLMKNRLFHALAVASGIAVEITPEARVLELGKTTNFVLRIYNRGTRTAQPHPLAFNGKTTEFTSGSPGLPPMSVITTSTKYHTPQSARISVPHSRHLYDGRFLGERMNVTAPITLEGASFIVTNQTLMDVAPPVEIEKITPSPVMVTPTTVNRPISFIVRVINYQATAFRETLSAQSARIVVNLPARATREFQLSLRDGLAATATNVTFRIGSFGLEPTVVPVAFSDARVSENLRVGYLRGFDYSLPYALTALGVESDELRIEDVRAGDLRKYNAIIVDNRVYESQPKLIAANHKLLDYAKEGGTLIVFYHKTNEWNPDPKRNRQQLAPYNLILDDDRITDENTPVTFLEPQHPLLNFPNKMGQEDFRGWIQERGLYYPKEWDSHFTALLASNDPGEEPLRGGLLVANYGRGHYIYSSMVWYRQLRAGVPGAYRMLANMISYGNSPK